MEKLLTPEQAAEFLNISKLTLYGWTSRGQIPFIKLGRLLRFDKSRLEQWTGYKAKHTPAGPPYRSLPIQAAGFSTRAINCLLSAKVRFVCDLLKLRAEELFYVKATGKATVAEIREVLSQHGLKLMDDKELDDICRCPDCEKERKGET